MNTTLSTPGTLNLVSMYVQTKKAAGKLRAFNHHLRQQFLTRLDEQGEQTVTQLYVHFRLEQSVASQHLAILRKAGLVTTRRDGKNIYYSVNQTALLALYGNCTNLNQNAN